LFQETYIVFLKEGTYIVVYRQNVANMLHNSVIMQLLLRIRKKNINFQV